MKILLAYLKARDFLGNRSGATAIEYGLIAALIIIGVIAWATSIGGTTAGSFDALNDGFESGPT